MNPDVEEWETRMTSGLRVPARSGAPVLPRPRATAAGRSRRREDGVRGRYSPRRGLHPCPRRDGEERQERRRHRRRAHDDGQAPHQAIPRRLDLRSDTLRAALRRGRVQAREGRSDALGLARAPAPSPLREPRACAPRGRSAAAERRGGPFAALEPRAGGRAQASRALGHGTPRGARRRLPPRRRFGARVRRGAASTPPTPTTTRSPVASASTSSWRRTA